MHHPPWLRITLLPHSAHKGRTASISRDSQLSHWPNIVQRLIRHCKYRGRGAQDRRMSCFSRLINATRALAHHLWLPRRLAGLKLLDHALLLFRELAAGGGGICLGTLPIPYPLLSRPVSVAAPRIAPSAIQPVPVIVASPPVPFPVTFLVIVALVVRRFGPFPARKMDVAVSDIGLHGSLSRQA